MNAKKNGAKNIFSVCFTLVCIAFVVVVAARQFIFEPNTLMFNLYSEDVADQLLVRVLKTLVIIAGGIVVMKLAKLITKMGELSNNNSTKTAMLLIGNVIRYVVAIAIIFVVLSAWGIDTTAIVTGAGVITLIIGLGCQTLVSDVVAGIFMLFEGDIQVGDIVVVNGWRGTVQQIGLRRTRIEDAVGNINIINNSSISNIINNTRKLSIAACDVGIEYNESIERVENILRENLPLIKKNIPAIVEGPFYKGVSELGASAVNIKLIAKCKEEDKYQTERDMNREIKLLFDRHNINIPFDQIVVNYREENETQTTVTKAEMDAAKRFLEYQKIISRGMEDQNT